MSEPYEARNTVNWLRQCAARRTEERERCYQIVYAALVSAEAPEAIEALAGVAIKIIDP